MYVSTRTYWLPKHGNTLAEYEDAAAPVEPFVSEVSQFKCAVADGATEASFSGSWAKLLVDGYVRGVEWTNPAGLSELAGAWQSSLDGQALPWYAEQKAQSGAFAAVVGLFLRDDLAQSFTDEAARRNVSGQWRASACGDSCLWQVRAGSLLCAFPLTQSGQFDNSPALVSSNLESNAGIESHVVRDEGQWQPGDCFYLASDALSRWFFWRQETAGDALAVLSGIASQDALAELVTSARQEKTMRNDDVTLMIVQL